MDINSHAQAVERWASNKISSSALFGYLAPIVKRAVYNFVPTSTKLELGQSPLMRYIGDRIQITSKNWLDEGHEAGTFARQFERFIVSNLDFISAATLSNSCSQTYFFLYLFSAFKSCVICY